ncbi:MULTISPECIES: LysM peptidoglycan-binding domain-containing protein [Aequorivita]|uniref:LysM peptidoglycan-binding domain-containing protein n=1 Tax=Aequorivita iocasae TaxID=2803865 RepID=A0ABX7DXX6_9FLAO|nr:MULTISPECIES: LysM peptidoglycan-binding domain-containing protein [Aequorivita]QQX77614.1 LysM peptidoglycan-binding domain-containing protein [Aequorivita iocasae]UCA57111.1 LysM peptidoglycan-binding domain-containing protein [Aequorivita sp. F7]
MKLNKILPLVLLLAFSMSFAQQGKKQSKKLNTKKVQVVDSIKVSKIAEELPSTVLATSLKDSTVFDLKDMALARKKDSLWLKELYKSDLFEDIYNSITDQDYGVVDYDELPTEVLKQRLKDLDARTPFKVEYNASLESVIKQYLKNRRGTLERLMGLSEYYFPMFEEELDRHNLPLELKYLAVIESALNPRAQSRVGATGLWQFMYPTGKMFGLDVSSYVDERSDPIMATEAACKYLKSLNNSFNDWDLALAAYNSGPGNVSKAIRRSGGKTNYWSLRNYLPRETAGYVPAFLATMYIFEYAQEHGFKKQGPRIPYIATDTIKIKQQLTLDQIAKLTNLDREELEFLNPSYKLGIIPVIKDENYMLRLPLTAVGTFVTNEAAIYAFAQEEVEEAEKPMPELYEQPEKIRYRVKRGDYLGRIAERYGVGVSQIKSWNGMRSNTVKVGQNLIIYPNKSSQDIASNAPVQNNTSEKTYTVRNGDSLWSISQKFPGVSVQNIKNWNDISGNNLKPGTKLKIYKG